MARYRRRRYYRSRKPKSMLVSVLSPLNRGLSKLGLRNKSLRWFTVGIGSMFLTRTFWEDGFDMIIEKFDDGADWVQDTLDI